MHKNMAEPGFYIRYTGEYIYVVGEAYCPTDGYIVIYRDLTNKELAKYQRYMKWDKWVNDIYYAKKNDDYPYPYMRVNLTAMGAMPKFFITRPDGKKTTVLLLPHKIDHTWSFVNVTKGHICPCKFKTPLEAIEDMLNRHDVTDWSFSIITQDLDDIERPV